MSIVAILSIMQHLVDINFSIHYVMLDNALPFQRFAFLRYMPAETHCSTVYCVATSPTKEMDASFPLDFGFLASAYQHKTWHCHVKFPIQTIGRSVGHGCPSPRLLRDGKLANGRPQGGGATPECTGPVVCLICSWK